MIVFAHLSDTHLDGTPRATARTAAVLAYLDRLPYDLDAILVTGDIADHGLPAEYEEARRLLASRHPVLTCPGNHDVRAPYRQVLLDEPVGDGPVNQAHRIAGAVFAMCDSSIPGRDDGRLDDETLTWLEGVLVETPPGTPVFVVFHHPPVVLHAPYVDGIRQFGEDRLAGLIGRHPDVVAVLCGHAHTPAATAFAGRPLLVAPGVVSTTRLPWETGTWGTDTDGLVDLDIPPALAFHVLDDEGRLTTHYRVVTL
ncbi:metallophosphoesterase [Actinoallomurus purpureus]|uniref:metallophosphoesterase n=1 Tax=Actinoallomurus purpureus TaxID=478114 RepID=UPI0020928FB3|nr:metallophosphoesterase [Actinoallomurus purpureus]MCO6010496.1 metallophosphoesterase [Actinoallomurus purpureus]